jgi:hypothetical protein
MSCLRAPQACLALSRCRVCWQASVLPREGRFNGLRRARQLAAAAGAAGIACRALCACVWSCRHRMSCSLCVCLRVRAAACGGGYWHREHMLASCWDVVACRGRAPARTSCACKQMVLLVKSGHCAHAILTLLCMPFTTAQLPELCARRMRSAAFLEWAQLAMSQQRDALGEQGRFL